MSQPIKTVNMFGPIGGTDYLKQTLANKFKSKLKGNPMLTAMGTNPIPGQAQPQQVSKNAGQMHPRFSSNGGVASLSAPGTVRIPNIDSDRQVLKAAMEKLISGGTYDDELVDKTAFLGVALKAAPLVGRLGMGAWRIARGAAPLTKGVVQGVRGGTGAAQAFNKADTIGGGVSAAAKSFGTAVRSGASHSGPAGQQAYRQLRRVGKQVGGAANSNIGRNLGGAMYGSALGYGVDTGAGMAGIDTGGMGTMIGGGIGGIGAKPLLALRRAVRGKRVGKMHGPAYPEGYWTPSYQAHTPLRHKLVNTGDNLARSISGFGKRHTGKLHTAAGLGGVGMVQSATTGGLYDMTDLQGNISRAQEFGRDSAARGLGYEGGYDEMTQDISPVVQDIRRTLDEYRQQQAVVPQGQDLRQLVRAQRANPF